MDLETALGAADHSYRTKLVSEDEDFEEPDYSKKIPFGREIGSGRLLHLELDSTSRLGAFGPSGSGKTTLAKAVMSRARKDDWKLIHGSDVKNDFRTFDRKGGASKKLQNETEGLIPGEEPESQDRIMAIPHFMVDQYQSRPQYGTIFSMDLTDLTEAEFKFLSGFHDWDSESARESLDEMLLTEDLERSSLDQLLGIAESKYKNNTLSRKLKGVKNQKLLSRRVDHNMDQVLDRFNDVGVLSLGLKGWRNYLNGQEHFFQFYSGKLLREFKAKTEKGDIDGKYIYFMDEAHKLMPQGEESMVKDEFQDFYDVSGRQRDVVTFLSTQRPSQIPNPTNFDELDFISNLTDVFLMRGKTPLHENQWKPIVSNMGVYNKDGSEQLKKWQRKIQSLKRFDGIYINSEKHNKPEDCPRFRSLSPLVAHPG